VNSFPAHGAGGACNARALDMFWGLAKDNKDVLLIGFDEAILKPHTGTEGGTEHCRF